MVGLPVTAEEKFREAAYFYNRMVETRTNVYHFPFNFSAFLSASRSVTFYLQEQHSDHTNFKAWYSQKQNELRRNPALARLKDLRNQALHATPVQLLITQGPRIPEEGMVIHSVAFDTAKDGSMRTFVQLQKDGPDTLVESLADWNIETKDGPNVLQICHDALGALRALLDEWYAISPPNTSPQLPRVEEPR